MHDFFIAGSALKCCGGCHDLVMEQYSEKSIAHVVWCGGISSLGV